MSRSTSATMFLGLRWPIRGVSGIRPVMWLGGVETSCATERGIKASGSVGHIDVWIPLEKTNGRLQLRFTAQTEWQYDPAFIRTVIMNSEMNNNFANTLKAKAGVSALLKGGIGKQLSRDEQILVETSFEALSSGGGVVEPMYFFSIMEARDVVRTNIDASDDHLEYLVVTCYRHCQLQF